MANNEALIQTDFGQSRYGERMSYSKPVYRDLWCGILFWIHVAGITFLSVFWGRGVVNEVNRGSGSSGSSGSTSTTSSTSSPSSVTFNVNFPLTGIVVTVLMAFVVGILFGLLWLWVMKKFAATIIKTMLFLNLAAWIVLAGIGAYLYFVRNNSSGVFMMVIGIVFFLIYGLYTWCVWGRIPFASALLKIASSITSKYSGTICISLGVILFSIIWNLLWLFSFIGYVVSVKDSQASNLVIFLLILSFYWGMQVWKNVSHTTTCGVAATWYFNQNARYPTGPAFKRTMTTSFGSVCLGSFIVAFLQAVRAMVRSMRGNAILKCIALCLLACIESLIRYFNVYAYAQCAIYGKSFIEGAKATFELLSSELWKAVINDDLTGLALFCGAMMGFIFCGALGYLSGYIFYKDSAYSVEIPLFLGIYCAIVGLCLVIQTLYVVRSAIVCIFVCYAEDPKALKDNHPTEYGDVTGVKPELVRIAEGQTTIIVQT